MPRSPALFHKLSFEDSNCGGIGIVTPKVVERSSIEDKPRVEPTVHLDHNRCGATDTDTAPYPCVYLHQQQSELPLLLMLRAPSRSGLSEGPSSNAVRSSCTSFLEKKLGFKAGLQHRSKDQNPDPDDWLKVLHFFKKTSEGAAKKQPPPQNVVL